MLTILEIKSFLDKNFGKTDLKKRAFFDNDEYWEMYIFSFPLNAEINIQIEFVAIDENNIVNTISSGLATKVLNDKFYSFGKKVNLSSNWKENLLDAINEIKIEIKDKTKITDMAKEIRSIPMFNFDSFLQSLEDYLTAHGALTPAQQNALKKVKWRYQPKVPLNNKQIAFLHKMNNLPSDKMSSDEKEIISKMYAKACSGTEWNDEERTQVLSIMKKYNAL
jgi:hypothetical protein